jgi:hypothetical protein
MRNVDKPDEISEKVAALISERAERFIARFRKD